jgi:hypothetical protein
LTDEIIKRFIIEQSDDDISTSHSGLALIGLCLNRYSGLSQVVGSTGLLCHGKSDYAAIRGMRDDDYFKSSLGISKVPSAERLRQRLGDGAENYLKVVNDCSMAMLKNSKAHLTPLDTGHIPLDADVFPQDNSGTKKEKVSYTYKGNDGYAPMAAYLGLEGWCLEVELRPGSQHCRKGFPGFLKRVVAGRAQSLSSL